MPKRKQSDAVKARIAGMREKNSRVQAAAELQSMTPAEKKARKYRNDAVWVPRVLSCMRVLSLSCGGLHSCGRGMAGMAGTVRVVAQ